ncbi:MAG: ABC transporter permease [Acidobacteriia bacterium]|nr:ABC transporter permease [Terriglobia bacterium]
MNPMIRKEVRQRMRERRGWLLPSLYLVALGAVVVFAYFLATVDRPYAEVQGSQIGVALFLTVAFAQLALLLLLAPIFSAGALTIEKEQRTLAGLLTSLLTVNQIWWGKFAASLLFVVLLLVTSLPVMSLAFAFGGIGPWEVFIVTATTIIILASMSAVGLYWSSVFRRSMHATAVGYGTVIVLCVVTAILFFVRLSMMHQGAAMWAAIPLDVRAPIYANPFFFLLVSLSAPRHLYPDWAVCCGIFAVLGLIAVALTLRNLRRSGEVS